MNIDVLRARFGWLRLVCTVATGLVAACARTDGTPEDKSLLGLTSCRADLDCGTGRFCKSNVCTLECVTSGDCALLNVDPRSANDFTCSACGRCLKKGVSLASDRACVRTTDQPCTDSSECSSLLGDAYQCDVADRTCVRKCTLDDNCKDLGRGFGCDKGACKRTCFRESDCALHGFKYTCVLPAGVDAAANEEAVTPVFGSCRKSDVVPGFKAPSPADPKHAAFQGVWGMIATSGVRVSGLPVVTRVDEIAVYRWLAKATWSGTDVTFRIRFCSAEITQFDADDFPVFEFFKVTTPDKNVDAIRMNSLVFRGAPALLTGLTLGSDEMLDLRGVRLKDPVGDPLPSYKTPTDPTIWDQDRDGNPGMTVRVTGGFTGELYQAQRWRTTAKLRVVDVDHLEGLLHGPSDATILGSTAAGLINDGVTTEHPQPDRSWLRATRMSNDSSCADVVTSSTKEGDFLAYSARYPGK